MAKVVSPDAIINPRTMAGNKLVRAIMNETCLGIANVLIVLGNTAATSATVLTAERLSRHTGNTKVLLVKLPQLK